MEAIRQSGQLMQLGNSYHVMNGMGMVPVGYKTFFVDKIHNLLVKFCFVQIFLLDTFENYFEHCTYNYVIISILCYNKWLIRYVFIHLITYQLCIRPYKVDT